MKSKVTPKVTSKVTPKVSSKGQPEFRFVFVVRLGCYSQVVLAGELRYRVITQLIKTVFKHGSYYSSDRLLASTIHRQSCASTCAEDQFQLACILKHYYRSENLTAKDGSGATAMAIYCWTVQCSAVQYSAVKCSEVQFTSLQCTSGSCNSCSAVKFSSVQFTALQCSVVPAVQCSAVQCSAAQCNLVHCTAVPFSAVLCSTMQSRAVQCC